MWGWLYIALMVLGATLTWAYAVHEEAMVFTSSMATVAWAVLAITREIELVARHDAGTITREVGAVRFMFGALALLSLVAFIGASLGIFPESHPESDFTNR